MLGVLIGDGDGRARRAAAARFEQAGHHVLEASDGAYAIDLLRERSFDLVVCDLAIPRVSGLAVFRHVRSESPHTAVVITSASPTIEDAVVALKEGAADFLMKPIDVDQLFHGVVARIAERRALKVAFDEARAWLVGRIVGAALIGDSPPMRRVLELIDSVAQSDCDVLVTGESGTGKDIVARTIYARSRRAARPFVTVDCTRGDAMEDDLFAAAGQLAAANGGTIFFDEVAEMPLHVQARLMHVLESEEGTGARVLAATHHDLRARMDAGEFRTDLFFRLRTVDLAMPPLRARKGDLSLLVHHLLERLTPQGFVAPGVAPRAWAALEAYDYPGNVRELARAVEHAMVLAHGSEIDREHLPTEIAAFARGPDSLAPLAVARRQFEREYARRALAACDGDIERAAELLVVAPDVLERKLAGRSSLPPPPSSVGAEHPVFPGPLGPVKAGVRARDERGSVAFADLVESDEAHTQSHAKLRVRARDR
jgi:two-component system response regulator HydG